MMVDFLIEVYSTSIVVEEYVIVIFVVFRIDIGLCSYQFHFVPSFSDFHWVLFSPNGRLADCSVANQNQVYWYHN